MFPKQKNPKYPKFYDNDILSFIKLYVKTLHYDFYVES